MYSLMIVDDEKSMLEGLTTLVNWPELGYEVTAVCRDGQEAIEHLAQNRVDAVLTDIRMPRASGLDIARTIHDGALPTRVVILSGYRDFDDARRAMRYGVRHYLTKPFLPSSLREIMRELAQELDSQRSSRRLMRESFLSEAAMGVLRAEADFSRWVEVLHIDESTLARPCALIDIRHAQPLPVSAVQSILSRTPWGQPACIVRLSQDCLRLLYLDRGNGLPGDGQVGRWLGEAAQAMPVSRYKTLRALSMGAQSLPMGEAPATRQRLPQNDAAAAACRYIQEHYAQKLSLSDVAGKVYLNPAYLSRLFREQTGLTFSEYLTNTRILAAAQMLATTRIPVYTICESVGYNNLKYFYRLFKQIMEVTPSEYRALAERRGSA